MKPNIVVGLVGLTVFVVATVAIASGFRDLVGLGTYQSTFSESTVRLHEHGNTLAGGTPAAKAESFVVGHANLTRILVHVTWREGLATHEVSVTVRNPGGATVGAPQKGTGGSAGLTVAAPIHALPSGERYTANTGAAQAAFDARYESYPEDRGAWTVQVASKGPGGPTDNGIDYTASFEYKHWTGVFARVPELSK